MLIQKYETFYITNDTDCAEHEIGNLKCGDCWLSYPKKCSCGGLIHAQFGDEYSNGDWWLDTKCDNCGKEETL